MVRTTTTTRRREAGRGAAAETRGHAHAGDSLPVFPCSPPGTGALRVCLTLPGSPVPFPTRRAAGLVIDSGRGPRPFRIMFPTLPQETTR